MATVIKIHSKKKGEINKFLSKFYNTNLEIEKKLRWEKEYKNPIEMAELIVTFADNIDEFDIKMWVSLDKDIFINISDKNANNIIKYLFERYPY